MSTELQDSLAREMFDCGYAGSTPLQQRIIDHNIAMRLASNVDNNCGKCVTCGTQCESGGEGSVLCPLCELLDAIVDIGSADIYTDAREYSGRVIAMQILIEVLRAHRNGGVKATLAKVAYAKAEAEEDSEE